MGSAKLLQEGGGIDHGRRRRFGERTRHGKSKSEGEQERDSFHMSSFSILRKYTLIRESRF
ncbi:MAG TPA: hypothetical protein VEG34_02000, partial [Thermoanaerobaculia bacterium]|nr:hypothetical protein [Thermoanaerobaculia bacterium]